MSHAEPTGKKPTTLPAGLDASRILNAHQAAELLGVSVATFRRLHWANKLPPAIQISTRRLGWRVSDLLAYVETCIAA